jgi:hypothetical protein
MQLVGVVIRNASESAAVPAEGLMEGSWEAETTAAGLPYTIAFDGHGPAVEHRDIVQAVACHGSCLEAYSAGAEGCRWRVVAYKRTHSLEAVDERPEDRSAVPCLDPFCGYHS